MRACTLVATFATLTCFGQFWIFYNIGGGIHLCNNNQIQGGSGSPAINNILLKELETLMMVSRQQQQQQQKKRGEEENEPTQKAGNKFSVPGYPKIHIGIISAFDWGEQEPPFVSWRTRRQMHRDTWMQHPAVNNNNDGPDAPTIRAYFVIGNKQHQRQQQFYTKKATTHNITELQAEMEHYQDIVLLDAPDVHNFGKMNAWFEWAVSHDGVRAADYHIKLDDETYVQVDELLAFLSSNKAPGHNFFGGGSMGHILEKWHGHKIAGSPSLHGWAYILSGDLMRGLVDCTHRGKLEWNDGSIPEDLYTGAALRICNLDEPKSFNYKPNMKVKPLLGLLSSGCDPQRMEGAMFIHGGGGRGRNVNPFPKIAPQTFRTLHDIYHPAVGDLAPTWTKWETLRKIYLEDYKVCSPTQMKGSELCLPGWDTNTCDPTAATKTTRGRRR